MKLSKSKMVLSAFHLNNKEAKRELLVGLNGNPLPFSATLKYLGVTLDQEWPTSQEPRATFVTVLLQRAHYPHEHTSHTDEQHSYMPLLAWPDL